MDSLARDAEQRSSAFVMRTTKRTTVLAAKLVEKFSRTALCRGYWDRTGRARSRNSKPSNAANPCFFLYTWSVPSTPAMYMVVAAHAFATGLTLVTSDRSFRSLRPRLRLVDWSKPG